MQVPQHVQVSCAGELVVLAIGNIARSMEFDVALLLSAKMMAAGRTAKRVAGDDSRRYRAAGSMHDAGTDPVVSRFHHVPERISAVDSYPSGVEVKLQLGRDVLGMHYNAAFQIAQWLRIRGKEARNKAGESAHWSQIGRIDQAEARIQ